MTRRGVALTGFMGAGKSTIGRALAARDALPFVDLDEMLASAHGPIARQFALDGESVFRQRESSALSTLCDGTPRVLALGGGTYIAAANRVVLRRHYVTVYLEVPLPVLQARVGGDPARPLWNDSVAERYQARRPLYAMADLTVDASRPVDEVVAQIEEAL